MFMLMLVVIIVVVIMVRAKRGVRNREERDPSKALGAFLSSPWKEYGLIASVVQNGDEVVSYEFDGLVELCISSHN